MEELTEVITAAEFHPHQCNTFVYSSSKGTIRLCDMRVSALCDKHSKCEYPFGHFNHHISISTGGLRTGIIMLSPLNYALANARRLGNTTLTWCHFTDVFIIFLPLVQCLRSQKIPVIAPSSLRSYLLSQMSSLATTDDTWWPETTCPWRFGTWTWRAGQWRPIRWDWQTDAQCVMSSLLNKWELWVIPCDGPIAIEPRKCKATENPTLLCTHLFCVFYYFNTV